MVERMRLVSSAVALLAVLATAPSAGAAVTIGADTTSSLMGTQSCAISGGCSYANLQIPGRVVAAPFDGVIVRWRVQGGGGVGPLTPRVLRQLPGGAFTGAGTGVKEVIVPGAERTVPTRLAIKKGDYFGLDIDEPPANNEIKAISAAGNSRAQWFPKLADADPGRAASVSTSLFLIYNADVEPDCDVDGFGDETQDADLSACKASAKLGGKVKVRGSGARLLVLTGIRAGCGATAATCAGAATIRRAGGAGRAARASKAPKRLGGKKLSLVQGASRKVTVRLTRRASALLRERGRLRAKISVSIANAAGQPAVLTRRATLRAP